MADLPEPEFFDKRDLEVIRAECIARFEQVASRPLEPTQVERLIIDLIAYREHLLREQGQDAAKLNLWRYTRFPMGDLIAEVLGEGRLAAKPAKTVFAVTLVNGPEDEDVILPEGMRVRSKDGKVVFTVDDEHVILSGGTELSGIAATCTEAGPIGNGYVPGQVTEIVDGFPVELEIANTNTTAGGVAEETTDRMRERVPLAVKAFSVAGPEPAYERHALSAHVGVLDVAVSNPAPGVVRVTLLVAPDADEEEAVAAVEHALHDEDVRPITDTVNVDVAGPVDYELAATIEIVRGAKWSAVLPLLSAAWELYQTQRSVKLGTPPVVSQIYKVLSVAGVYRVTLTSPSELAVGPDEWARCTDTTFTFGGVEP